MEPEARSSALEGPVWRTWLKGEEIELPASINGIRAALPPERRGEFDQEVGAAAAGDLGRREPTSGLAISVAFASEPRWWCNG